MNTAGKFIALALQAYANKQFEDAGALFAQAAECSDVKKLTDALLQPVTSDVPDTQKPILNDNLQQLSSEDDETSGDEWGDEEEVEQENTKADGEEEAATEGEGEDTAEDDGDDQEESESADLESQSSGAVHAPARRKVTSMYQIGKILAAAMEATSSEDDAEETSDSVSDDEEEDDEDTDIMPEPDPDLPGEELVPVALSSVTLKGFVVNSPVKLKQ